MCRYTVGKQNHGGEDDDNNNKEASEGLVIIIIVINIHLNSSLQVFKFANITVMVVSGWGGINTAMRV